VSEARDDRARDDDHALRGAFARMRDDEAQRAPTLAELVARASREDAARAPRLVWLRLALPLTGAAIAAFAWWISTSALQPSAPTLTAPLIALGSLRSPTDALLASPLPLLGRGFSRSLIPAPPAATAPAPDTHSRSTPARRFSV
jgi:hypothetical protein